MNWGWKLIIVYGTFVSLMIMLVLKSRSAKIDLVRTDYYEAEIAHQEQMTASGNTGALSSVVKLDYTQGVVTFLFPVECQDGIVAGEIHFYRPSDVNLDKKFPLVLDTTNQLAIPTSEFMRGLYVVKMNWTISGKPYFQEESLFIQ